ncbi:MAG: hypothetical protein U9N32_05640, partial [Spirochaetota bacterium]|nr:hypothetical protein [Spirochaetota bacterium]
SGQLTGTKDSSKKNQCKNKYHSSKWFYILQNGLLLLKPVIMACIKRDRYCPKVQFLINR